MNKPRQEDGAPDDGSADHSECVRALETANFFVARATDELVRMQSRHQTRIDDLERQVALLGKEHETTLKRIQAALALGGLDQVMREIATILARKLPGAHIDVGRLIEAPKTKRRK